MSAPPEIAAGNELAVVVQQNGLAVDTGSALIETFQPIFGLAETLVREADAINVTDATQVTEIKKARAMRLKLREVRISADAARKQHKEESLRKGKAIDGIANIIKFMIEPVEERLLEQEQFAERKEAERKAALIAHRAELLRPFGVDPSFYQLGDMPEQGFAILLDSSRIAFEARQETARQVEAARVATESARVAEEKRIREENEKLRREAEAAEKAARIERERVAAEQRAAEAKARAEREAIEAKAAAELKAANEKARVEREAAEAKARQEREAAEVIARKEREKREALEAKARAEKQAAERKAGAEAKAKRAAAMAPDKEKLETFAGVVRALELPALISREGRAAAEAIRPMLAALASRIETMAAALEAELVAAH